MNEHPSIASLRLAAETLNAAVGEVRELLAQRDALRTALERLCTPPEGSAVVLGVHDSGRHFGESVDAWNNAHDLLAVLAKGDA